MSESFSHDARHLISPALTQSLPDMQCFSSSPSLLPSLLDAPLAPTRPRLGEVLAGREPCGHGPATAGAYGIPGGGSLLHAAAH